MRVAGLDLGGSSVKAWVADASGLLAEVAVPVPTLRPQRHRAELDPAVWEQACRTALARVVEQAGPGEWAGLTVASLRQGFLLLDAAGQPLSNGVLNSDRRGAPHTGVLEGRHALTGHWPAPELTLPKLLAVQAEEPDRWAATARVLFVHDWVVALLTGEQVTEVSYACAGAMADVAARGWAGDLLQECGVGTSRLAPLVQAGDVVGRLRPGWALPAGMPVVAGCGDTQLAAAGAGGLADGVVTVVAGSSTPVQASSALPMRDPLERPWVSTHVTADRWAAEGNAGYPGTAQGWWDGLQAGSARVPDGPGELVAVTAAPYWSRETWEHQPPTSLVGLRPDTTAEQVAGALAEAHAYAVAGGVVDLERALGRPAEAVVVCGGGAADGVLPALLAQVLGRQVHVAHGPTAAAAGVALVTGADWPGLPDDVVAAGDPEPWEAARTRWVEVTAGLRAALPGA
ncbi:MAG: Xylulokinase [Frankiales bacterium]|nr:Xylulokinase [Frankiales bacterium]